MKYTMSQIEDELSEIEQSVTSQYQGTVVLFNPHIPGRYWKECGSVWRGLRNRDIHAMHEAIDFLSQTHQKEAYDRELVKVLKSGRKKYRHINHRMIDCHPTEVSKNIIKLLQKAIELVNLKQRLIWKIQVQSMMTEISDR